MMRSIRYLLVAIAPLLYFMAMSGPAQAKIECANPNYSDHPDCLGGGPGGFPGDAPTPAVAAGLIGGVIVIAGLGYAYYRRKKSR